MAKGFLDIIQKVRGDGDDAGDEFGGGAGQDGSGLPAGELGDSFMFATGIECSYPTIDHGRIRRDEAGGVRSLRPMEGGLRPGAQARRAGAALRPAAAQGLAGGGSL